MSKSVIAPLRSGRCATIWAGVLPIMFQASEPIAKTSRLFSFKAITDGSARTIPSLRA